MIPSVLMETLFVCLFLSIIYCVQLDDFTFVNPKRVPSFFPAIIICSAQKKMLFAVVFILKAGCLRSKPQKLESNILSKEEHVPQIIISLLAVW